MTNTTHKFVAVLNKKIDIGVVMNALAHMSLGLVAKGIKELDNMGFMDFVDKDGDSHSSISKLSYVILRADNSNKIRTLRESAKKSDVLFLDFTSTMTGDTYIEQLERTKDTLGIDLEYYGICLFGEIEKVNNLTKKFSLWR